MSFAAIQWALSQPVEKSPAKFVLVAMASCVNAEDAEMLCWPSVAHLAETTGQDRKTVMEGMRRLREECLIHDTGERRGSTGQITVYLLKRTNSGTIAPPRSEPERLQSVGDDSTKSGTGTKSETVPDFQHNSTEIPAKESRISTETVPEAGHGTRKEPGRNQEGTRKRRVFDAAAIELPDWLDRESWTAWCADRSQRHKPITERAAALQLKALDGYRREGHRPEAVIENSISNSYQGLFPPKKQFRSAAPGNKHTTAAAGIFGHGQQQEVIDV